MPPVPLPRDFEVDGQQLVTASRARRSVDNNQAQASIDVNLQYGNYFIDLTTAKPAVSFRFFQRPSFDRPPDVIVYRPESRSDIDIAVSE